MPPQKQKVQPHPSPLDEPPTASSGSEEENQQHHSSSLKLHHKKVSSGEEEETSSGEEEEEASKDLPPPVSKNPPTNPQRQSSSSSWETQSGSETESEQDPPPVKPKPLASKPMDQPPKPKKSQPSPALSKSASKRPAENNNNAARATDPKRAKKKGTDSSAVSDEEMEEEGKNSGDQSKKVLKVWSDEDELSLLKGVSDFTAKTGQDPLKSTNSSAFFNFVKKSMTGEPSSIQLKEKLRRLKKKYEILAARAAKGDLPKFVKQHDERIFELAKKAWGAADLAVGPPNGSLDNRKSNGNAANTPKKKETVSRTIPSAKKSKPEIKSSDKMQIDQNVKSSEKMPIDQKLVGGDASSFLRELARFKEGASVSNLDEDDVKRGLELIGESKRAELRARWKKLQHAEMGLLANRLELIGEQTKLILEALRSSNH